MKKLLIPILLLIAQYSFSQVIPQKITVRNSGGGGVYYLSGLSDSTGFILNKPSGKDTVSLIFSGDVSSAGFNKQISSNSSSTTINNLTTWLIINPSSLSASMTISLPPAPSDGQKIDIVFGGVISSGTVVTSLTISPNTGQTILGATSFSNIIVGDRLIFQYNSTSSNWYQ